MPIAIVAAGIGAAGTIAGAAINKKATKKASQTAANTAAANNALQRETYAANAARLDPYSTRGNEAGAAVNSLLLGGPGKDAAFQDYLGSTGYNFRQKQGTDALNTGFASKGLLQSGAAMKALTRYGQDYASNEFDRYINQLQHQQNVGLAGASAVAGVGQNMANAVSQNNNNAATTSGNATLANAANTNALLGGLTNTVGQYLGNQSSYAPRGGAQPQYDTPASWWG